MKKKSRKSLVIIICIIAIFALAIADILSYGKITTKFLGMIVIVVGFILIPTILEFG